MHSRLPSQHPDVNDVFQSLALTAEYQAVRVRLLTSFSLRLIWENPSAANSESQLELMKWDRKKS